MSDDPAGTEPVVEGGRGRDGRAGVRAPWGARAGDDGPRVRRGRARGQLARARRRRPAAPDRDARLRGGRGRPAARGGRQPPPLLRAAGGGQARPRPPAPVRLRGRPPRRADPRAPPEPPRGPDLPRAARAPQQARRGALRRAGAARARLAKLEAPHRPRPGSRRCGRSRSCHGREAVRRPRRPGPRSARAEAGARARAPRSSREAVDASLLGWAVHFIVEKRLGPPRHDGHARDAAAHAGGPRAASTRSSRCSRSGRTPTSRASVDAGRAASRARACAQSPRG